MIRGMRVRHATWNMVGVTVLHPAVQALKHSRVSTIGVMLCRCARVEHDWVLADRFRHLTSGEKKRHLPRVHTITVRARSVRVSVRQRDTAAAIDPFLVRSREILGVRQPRSDNDNIRDTKHESFTVGYMQESKSMDCVVHSLKTTG